MSLIIATGSNLGNSISYLEQAKQLLNQHFNLIAASRVYRSAAVDYENQPDFLNQVLEYRLPDQSPTEVMECLLLIEKKMGRTRDILRGPRTIDLDIIFWELKNIQTDQVTTPHPRWMERSFVVRPFQELPFFKTVEKCFTIPPSFKIEAFPV